MWNMKIIDGRKCFFLGDRWKTRAYQLSDTELLERDEIITEDQDEELPSISLNPPYTTREKQPAKYPILPAGIYTLEKINYMAYMVKNEALNYTSFLNLDAGKEILDDYEHFKNKIDIYKQLNICPKRGVLLYGPPGTGKTTLIHKIIVEAETDNSIVCFLEYWDNALMAALSKDTRIKIMVVEEITSLLQSDGEVPSFLLNFLDGEKSVPNTFIIATTNYPERLPHNLVERPGRFDNFYKIDYLSEKDIVSYAEFLLKREITEEERTVLFTIKEMTIALLKEFLLLHARDGLTFKEVQNKVKGIKTHAKNSFGKAKPMGFTADDY